MFCGTPVEKHWPTFSGALINATVFLHCCLNALLKKKNASVAAFQLTLPDSLTLTALQR